MVSKKDFEAVAVAEIIKSNRFYRQNYCGVQKSALLHDHLIVELADYFATQNPNFDRKQFMKACGL